MKHKSIKFLLLSFIAVLVSGASSNIFAQTPSTPVHFDIKVDVKESHPVKGDVTLTWSDGDVNNPLGSYFRITQYKKINGSEIEERVGKVERNNNGLYKFRIEDLPPASYCYTVDLYDKANDVASDMTEKRCATIGDEKPVHDLFFNCELKFIPLGTDGQGSFFVDVVNKTNCEFEVSVLKSDIDVVVAEHNNHGANLKIKADKKGKYIAVLGLINKCDNSIVDKVELLICYGDCEHNDADIYFDKGTEFKHKLMEGVAWHYKINAISNSNCPLSYHLAESGPGILIPKGLNLDEKTGVLSWENPIKGLYNIPIQVKSTCDNGATYSSIVGIFILSVDGKEPEFTSILHCDLFDETNTVKEFHGRATVWTAEDKSVPPMPNHRVFTQEINGNSVDFKLPAGKYYLKVEAKGYIGQYYDDARSLNDAKIIEIGENAKVNIEMTLHALPTPELFELSGQVTDKNTGEPVQAIVSFVPAKVLLGSKSDLGPNTNFELKVKTDVNGKYTIKLPNTYDYYAMAEAIPTNATTTRYKLQWFEGAEAFYDADIIHLTQNQDGVNFKLEPYELEMGHIDGRVTDKAGNMIQSIVIALSLDENNKSNFKAVTRTDEKGYFYFDNLRYGNYILLSIPMSLDYIPGYFVQFDYTTLKWSEATKIGVGDFAPTINYQIIHKLADKDQARGIAKIIGRLLKGIKGVVPGGSSDVGDPISGGLVSLTNEDGVIVNYYLTDNEGNFELNDLMPGTYTLTIDKVGYEEYTEVITIDYGNTVNVETEVELNKVTATSVDYDNFGKAQLTVSPMPVSNISTISFDGTFGTSSIKLIDLTGNVVYQSNINTVNGINQFNLDSKNISAGAYILVINNNAKAISGGITIVK